MKNIRNKIERLGAAVAFAEAGEVDTALEFVRDAGSHQQAAEVTNPARHMFLRKFEQIMAAIAFAETGEHDTARELYGVDAYSAEKKAAAAAGVRVQKATAPGLAEKIGKVAEAVAFAEAGEYEHARELMGADALRKQKRGRILVVGRDYGFSDHLMDYATNIAARMDRDIVALNVTDDGPGGFLARLYVNIREDFKRLAAENAEVFKEKAAAAGIAFEHVIRFGDPDRVIRSVCEEIDQITYALTEPEISEHEAVSPDAARQWEVPVFCIVPHATA